MSQPDILTDKKERNDFLIAFFVILLAATFIWYITFRGDKQPIIQDIVTAELQGQRIEQAVIYESDTIIPSLMDESQVGYRTDSEIRVSEEVADAENIHTHKEKTSEGIDEAKEKVIDMTDDLKEDGKGIVGAASSLTEVVSESAEVVVGKPQDMVDDIKKSASELADKIETKVEEKVDMADEKTLTGRDRASSVGRDCHISVGLYNDPANDDQIKLRLESQGFDVYTKRFPRSTQVGVSVVCDSQEAESILSEIREDFAKDAFIEEYK